MIAPRPNNQRRSPNCIRRFNLFRQFAQQDPNLSILLIHQSNNNCWIITGPPPWPTRSRRSNCQKTGKKGPRNGHRFSRKLSGIKRLFFLYCKLPNASLPEIVPVPSGTSVDIPSNTPSHSSAGVTGSRYQQTMKTSKLYSKISNISLP